MAINAPTSTADDATAIINENIEEATDLSPKAIEKSIRKDIAHVSSGTRQKVETYLTGMSDATEGMVVESLDDGIGGLYDGSRIKINASSLEVGESIEQTVDQMAEIKRHEAYHAMNNHLEPMQTAATEEDSTTLQLGGQTFDTDETLIEGLTVHETGNQFVSQGYKDMEQDLLAAASSAGVSVDQLRTAVNEKKDLTLIDDRTRENADAEPQFAMAA